MQLFSARFMIALLTIGMASLRAEPSLVDCDEPVKSAKRGVCANALSDADFEALSPSVSWYYTWHYTDTLERLRSVDMEFIPMVWGDRPDSLEGLKNYLRRHEPSVVLAINEPNLRGQAFIDPETTARLYKEIKDIADRADVPVVGPHMALGSAEGDSIRAFDPLERKEISYTFMVPFLNAFLEYMGDTEVSGIGTHSYGNFGEFSWMIGMLKENYGRPIWVTEFAWWDAPSLEAARDYMIQAVDLMERDPEVAGYAWFKERANDNPKISLLNRDSGELSMLGETYVKMPVHDPRVYYRLPGRLQLESYTEMSHAEIAATTDADGFLEMKVSGASSELLYQVSVEEPGEYEMTLRFSMSKGGQIDLLSETGIELATFRADTTGWQSDRQRLRLPTGNYKLRLKPGQTARLNWLEFSRE